MVCYNKCERIVRGYNNTPVSTPGRPLWWHQLVVAGCWCEKPPASSSHEFRVLTILSQRSSSWPVVKKHWSNWTIIQGKVVSFLSFLSGEIQTLMFAIAGVLLSKMGGCFMARSSMIAGVLQSLLPKNLGPFPKKHQRLQQAAIQGPRQRKLSAQALLSLHSAILQGLLQPRPNPLLRHLPSLEGHRIPRRPWMASPVECWDPQLMRCGQS